jgi:hypothetical protein
VTEDTVGNLNERGYEGVKEGSDADRIRKVVHVAAPDRAEMV